MPGNSAGCRFAHCEGSVSEMMSDAHRDSDEHDNVLDC